MLPDTTSLKYMTELAVNLRVANIHVHVFIRSTYVFILLKRAPLKLCPGIIRARMRGSRQCWWLGYVLGRVVRDTAECWGDPPHTPLISRSCWRSNIPGNRAWRNLAITHHTAHTIIDTCKKCKHIYASPNVIFKNLSEAIVSSLCPHV